VKELYLYHYDPHNWEDDPMYYGPHERITGDCSNIWGDCSGIDGIVSGLWGDATGVECYIGFSELYIGDITECDYDSYVPHVEVT
tara:strand:- start:1731 stop:1985 length:255 start_codon:yes stop_codon:yes gene_type:complete